MICETCIHFETCIERRGLCMDYRRRKTLEEIRNDVIRINEKYKTTGSAKADTSCAQEKEDGGNAGDEAD